MIDVLLGLIALGTMTTAVLEVVAIVALIRIGWRTVARVERIRQQVELVREQVLLATDAAGIAKSVDVLQATLGEANRWLRDQRELFGGLDSALDEPAPDTFLAPRRNDPASGVRQ